MGAVVEVTNMAVVAVWIDKVEAKPTAFRTVQAPVKIKDLKPPKNLRLVHLRKLSSKGKSREFDVGCSILTHKQQLKMWIAGLRAHKHHRAWKPAKTPPQRKRAQWGLGPRKFRETQELEQRELAAVV